MAMLGPVRMAVNPTAVPMHQMVAHTEKARHEEPQTAPPTLVSGRRQSDAYNGSTRLEALYGKGSRGTRTWLSW
jgi:hypothetical protein